MNYFSPGDQAFSFYLYFSVLSLVITINYVIPPSYIALLPPSQLLQQLVSSVPCLCACPSHKSCLPLVRQCWNRVRMEATGRGNKIGKNHIRFTFIFIHPPTLCQLYKAYFIFQQIRINYWDIWNHFCLLLPFSDNSTSFSDKDDKIAA